MSLTNTLPQEFPKIRELSSDQFSSRFMSRRQFDVHSGTLIRENLHEFSYDFNSLFQTETSEASFAAE